MKLPPPLRGATWLRAQFSATVLVALLQRSPVMRLAQLTSDIVASSPVGAVLKSTLAALGTLGAVQSLAGATTLLASMPSPVTLTQGTAIPNGGIAFTVTDTIDLGSWKVSGTVPPGLKLIAAQGGAELTGPGVLDATTSGGGVSDDPYGPSDGGGNLITTPILVGTPTQPGTYTITFQAFQLGGLSGLNTVPLNYTITVAASSQPPTTSAPSFASQPQTQSIIAGGNITLSATVSGTPAPTYQWRKDGAAIAGATNATLALTNVQVSDAGVYTLVATNSAGTVTSANAVLTVAPPAGTSSLPAVARQPQNQTIATGSTVVFAADATGGSLTYQWRKNGTAISGATRSTLVLNRATAADAGAYSVVIANSVGSTTSGNATLGVVNETNFGHLVNLSIRTTLTAAEPSFTLGTVLGGGTTPNKAVLVRAVGPSLAAFGLTGALPDSRLDLVAGGSVVATNDNWTGDSTVFSQVGAFPFAGSAPKDAAIYNAALPARDYTVQVAGVGNATGDVLAELYDATPNGAFNESTPRLVNVSVRKQIDTGGTLTAGFVIGGNTARTVLIRAIGPGLAAFGVSGTIVDPQLTLNAAGGGKVAENDNWGGDPQLTAVGSSVGAFAIANAAGKDAMILITLAPGGYTVDVSGIAGTAGGSTLVEIYEVP